MAELLAGAPGVRDGLLTRLQAARAAADAAAAADTATLLLLHTLADFADFRGLAPALAAFDAAPPDTLRADAARLGRPMLDHRYRFDDPVLAPARQRVAEALRAGSAVAADERVLLAKVLSDFDGLREADGAVLERLLALMQDTVPLASPRWQATPGGGCARSVWSTSGRPRQRRRRPTSCSSWRHAPTTPNSRWRWPARKCAWHCMATTGRVPSAPSAPSNSNGSACDRRCCRTACARRCR